MEKNILGTQLESCCTDLMTGFFRDGSCRTCPEDTGLHTVCAVVTEAFLNFSKLRGNDLTTPRPEFDFPGLKPGDKWCLCLGRWLEAYEAGVAPKISLNATHSSVLEHIDLEMLTPFAINENYDAH